MPTKTTKTQAAVVTPEPQVQEYIRVIELDPRKAVGYGRQATPQEFAQEVLDTMSKYTGKPCRIQFDLRTYADEKRQFVHNWLEQGLKSRTNGLWNVYVSIKRLGNGKYSCHHFEITSTAVAPAVADLGSFPGAWVVSPDSLS